MTTASILANKAWVAAAALVLVAGVAQQVSAQSAAAIRGTVTNALTGAPVANATVRVVARSRFSVTGGDGGFRLVVEPGQSEVRVAAIGFAPASQVVELTPGGSTTIVFALQPSAVPLDKLVTVGTRAVDRTETGSPVPVDVISVSCWRIPV